MIYFFFSFSSISESVQTFKEDSEFITDFIELIYVGRVKICGLKNADFQKYLRKIRFVWHDLLYVKSIGKFFSYEMTWVPDKNFNNMRKANQFIDIEFIGPHHRFNAHRMIVQSASHYYDEQFNAMLRWQEIQKGNEIKSSS